MDPEDIKSRVRTKAETGPLTQEQRQYWEQQLVIAERAYEHALKMLGWRPYKDCEECMSKIGNKVVEIMETTGKEVEEIASEDLV